MNALEFFYLADQKLCLSAPPKSANLDLQAVSKRQGNHGSIQGMAAV